MSLGTWNPLKFEFVYWNLQKTYKVIMCLMIDMTNNIYTPFDNLYMIEKHRQLNLMATGSFWLSTEREILTIIFWYIFLNFKCGL